MLGDGPLKRIFCLLLGLLFCLSAPGARAEEGAVEQARQSLVRLYGLGMDTETGQRSRWTGTGFAVGIAGEDSDIFLTNWHVATGSGKFADEQVELWILRDEARFGADGRPLDGCAVRCRVLITTGGYPDVAVVQAMEPVSGYKALPLLSSRRAARGISVYALGFPGLESVDDSGPEDVCITSGKITDHLTMTNAGNSHAIIHSAPILHGFSGGPLVDERGVAVAQNTYGFEEDVSTELFCAVYLDYGMELLDRLNIPYTTARGPSAIVVMAANLRWILGVSPALAAALGLGVVLALVLLANVISTLRLGLPGRKSAPEKEEESHAD